MRSGGEKTKPDNNLRYADDTILMAICEQDLQKDLNEVAKENEAKGLDLNVKKTEYMVSPKQKNVHLSQFNQRETIDNLKIELQVPATETIASDIKYLKEINKRIAITKGTQNTLKTIQKNRGINSKTKMKTVKMLHSPLGLRMLDS